MMGALPDCPALDPPMPMTIILKVTFSWYHFMQYQNIEQASLNDSQNADM